jgi:PAS domain S-box-containing protein
MWLNTLQYTKNEVIGKWFGDFLHPDQKEIFRKLFPENIKRTDLIKGVLFNLIKKDGSVLVAEYSARISRDNDGNFLRTHCVFQDITERREAEKALQVSEHALRKAQHVAHVGSWVWHVQEDRLEWSDEMYNIFGVNKKEFTGSLNEVVGSIIHPDDRAAVEKSNLSVKYEKKPMPLEYRVIRNDKTERTVWAEAGELILDDNGNPFMLFGIVQDITERKKAENELKKKVEELEWLNSMMQNREIKMIELKKEINSLLKRLKEDEKYVIHEPGK